MRGFGRFRRSVAACAAAIAIFGLTVADAAAQNTRVTVEQSGTSPTTVNFYVHKAIRSENVFYAANHSHDLSRRDPRFLREMGVRAIERRTGCAVDPDTVIVTIFRSEMFGIYSSRIDGEVRC